jgi:2-polyprenyl-6-hydroxyphenyl methylase/3-demethylubiquinone-9 3-methyltransferase
MDNRYYEELGPAWWDPAGPMGLLLRMNRFRYRYFRAILGEDIQRMRILDAGCGGGFLAEALAEDGADVYGLDLSCASVRTAREHAAAKGIRIHVLSGRAESLPFASGVFDVLLLADVLEHLDDFRAAVAESSRVLKPGGLLLYETANRTLLSLVGAIWLMERILKKIPAGSHEWRSFIRPPELAGALESCGLQNRELKGIALKGGVPGFLRRAATGRDPWIFEIGSDTRVSYLGYAIKPARGA